MFLFIMTGPPHAAQASFKFAILLSQLPKCWDCRCTLLKSRWWASLRLCHKQRTALAFVSNPKLKSIWIKTAKSNWPVQFQPSLVLRNTFVSGRNAGKPHKPWDLVDLRRSVLPGWLCLSKRWHLTTVPTASVFTCGPGWTCGRAKSSEVVAET